MRVILIGCGQQKRIGGPWRACELYTGPIFSARRSYAERQVASGAADAYLILSAKYGLVTPERRISLYELPIQLLSAIDRVAWRCGCVTQLVEWLDNDLLDDRDLAEIEVEIHAGHEYSAKLANVLRANGFAASTPMENLVQGMQLKWYRERMADAAEASSS
jgi:hypothetical protein